MAAGDGDVRLSTQGSGGERGGDGGDGSPGGAGATAAAGSSWVATLLATGGEMLLNVALVALVLLGAYRLWVRWGRRGLGSGPGAGEESPAATLPRMKKRDFSLEQLRQYDGARTPRILLAVNGKVFDVTKGSKFYGPGESEGCRGPREPSPPPGPCTWTAAPCTPPAASVGRGCGESSEAPHKPALVVPALPNPCLLAAFPEAEILRVVTSHVGAQPFS